MVKSWIKIEDLREGYLYEIKARQAKYGIWTGRERNSFVISRVKFTHNFIFEEIHYDASNDWGTAKPVLEIEKSPFDPRKLAIVTFERDGKKYFGYPDEAKVLEYLNKFEKKKGE